MARSWTDAVTGATATATRDRIGRSGRDRGEWLVVARCNGEEVRLLAYRDPARPKMWRTTVYIMGRTDGFTSLANVAELAMREARRNYTIAALAANGWL